MADLKKLVERLVNERITKKLGLIEWDIKTIQENTKKFREETKRLKEKFFQLDRKVEKLEAEKTESNDFPV